MLRASLLVVALLSVFLLAAPALAAEPVGYAKPELLANQPAVVKLWAKQKPVVLLDVRSQAKFDAGHVPTARRIDIGEWKKAFGDGSDAAAWGRRIGGLGIGADTTVVVYDETFSPGAARAWWLLKYWGVGDARVLNGGWRGWHPPKVLFPLPERGPTEFIAKPHPARLADYGKVLLAVAGDSAHGACLVDTRTDAEVAAGAIPTAEHSDWARYVDPKTGKLRPAEDLKKLLDAAGYEADRPAITYCRTGGRASVVAFVMELMSGQPAANYWGSWTDWQQRGGEPASGE